MACNLTIGRAEACKEAIGGLKAVYFINFQIVPSDVTFSNDLITAVINVDNLYKYELKSNENVFDQNRVGILLGYRFTPQLKLEGGFLSQIVQLPREVNGSNVFQYNNGLSVSLIFNSDLLSKKGK